VNDQNLAALKKVEEQLNAKAAHQIYELAAIDSGTRALALSRAAATEAELARDFGVRDCSKDPRCRTVLGYRLATIELDYWARRDEDQQKVRDLEQLHQEFSEAFSALRTNGEGIQKYLELNWFERLCEDAKGFDPEQLEKIGGDLKDIAARLTGSEQ
jgi:hypothetical protein